MYLSVCVSLPTNDKDATKGQFFGGIYQVSIQNFPSPRLLDLPKLKSAVWPTIYPQLEGV